MHSGKLYSIHHSSVISFNSSTCIMKFSIKANGLFFFQYVSSSYSNFSLSITNVNENCFAPFSIEFLTVSHNEPIFSFVSTIEHVYSNDKSERFCTARFCNSKHATPTKALHSSSFLPLREIST